MIEFHTQAVVRPYRHEGRDYTPRFFFACNGKFIAVCEASPCIYAGDTLDEAVNLWNDYNA